jgi:hypothetical protein
MNRQEIEKLIGGYATGTLTPNEEQALFDAALEDQQLFDALMGEQPVRDLLRDPVARGRLLAALSARPAPWYRRFARPLIAVTALLVVGVPLAIWQASRHPAPEPVLTAQMSAPTQPAVRDLSRTAPAPAPALPRAPARRAKARGAAVASVKPPEMPEVGTPPKDLPTAEAPQLKAAAKQETVEVRSQDAAIPPGAAAPVNGFVPSPQPARVNASPVFAMMEALSPVKTTVLRRNADGEFVAAQPSDLHAGDTIKLHLESSATGYVYVSEQQNMLTESAIEAGKPVETTIAPQGPGILQLQIRFSRRPVIWNAASGNGTAASPPRGLPPITLTLQYK